MIALAALVGAIYVCGLALGVALCVAAGRPTPANPSSATDSPEDVKQASADTLALNNPDTARAG